MMARSWPSMTELVRTYIFAGTQRIAYVKNDTTSYTLTDHLGNTRTVLTEYGVIPAVYDYFRQSLHLGD